MITYILNVIQLCFFFILSFIFKSVFELKTHMLRVKQIATSRKTITSTNDQNRKQKIAQTHTFDPISLFHGVIWLKLSFRPTPTKPLKRP